MSIPIPAALGLNAGHNFSGISAEQCAAWGAHCVRFPLLADADPVPAIKRLKALGILPLPLLVRESFYVGSEVRRTVEQWGEILRPHTQIIQALNEADGAHSDEDASWMMSASETNRWLGWIRAAFPRSTHFLVGPGLVSGQPDWARQLDLSLLDALAVHPYAKDPGARGRPPKHRRLYPPSLRYVPPGAARGVPVGPMLDRYSQIANGLPLVVSEYDSRTPGMGAYLKSRQDVMLALAFSGHSYLDFGIIDYPERQREFLSISGGPITPPTPPPEPPPMNEYVDWTHHAFEGFGMGKGVHDALLKYGLKPIGHEEGHGPSDQYHWLLAEKRNGDEIEHRLVIWNAKTDRVSIIAGGYAA